MPVTKSAKKKLRKDVKREKENQKFEVLLKKALKDVSKNVDPKKTSGATKLIDKAVKKNLIHSNKGSRLKSKLAKLGKQAKAPASASTKKASKRS